MVTVADRLKAWRRRSDYLVDEVSARKVNNGVIVDISIFTRARNGSAIERIERWVVPKGEIDDYLKKPAYKRSYTLYNRAYMFIGFHRRRWFR